MALKMALLMLIVINGRMLTTFHRISRAMLLHVNQCPLAVCARAHATARAHNLVSRRAFRVCEFIVSLIHSETQFNCSHFIA